MTGQTPKDSRRRRGFERAASLVSRQIRGVSEKRGFAESRLLTHWAEVAGQEIADISRPVKVGYARGGFGATLVLLTTGAQAPFVQARIPEIRERVNACYGYSAISHIRVTQTATQGFEEGRVQFRPKPPEPPVEKPDPEANCAAREAASGVSDNGLAEALERLGQNVLSRPKS